MGFVFLTQQNRRVIYFATNIVVVQKIHFACWSVASLCVCTLGNLTVEPALWLQCSVIERLNCTASGSPLQLFLPYSLHLPPYQFLRAVYKRWAGFSVGDMEGVLLGGGGRSKVSPVSVNWVMTVLLTSLVLHGTAHTLFCKVLFPLPPALYPLLTYFASV